MRQLHGLVEATGHRRHTEAAFRWNLARAIIQTLGGSLDEFPDYVGSEDGHLDPEVIEARLDAMLASGALRH
jgi:hypothetical protein